MKTKNGESPEQRLDRWFTDPDTWVGVFENADLGHPDIGRRIGIPFRLSDGSYEGSIIGTTRSPDMREIILGWRYLLRAKCKNTAEALVAMKEGR